MLVKIVVRDEKSAINNFNWCVLFDNGANYEIIGDIDETKLDNVKEYLVSKYIEQKVSSNDSSSTNSGTTK